MMHGMGDVEVATQVLISPVFREGSDRRRRVLRRAGCGIAALCLFYLAMLGVSITAMPVLRMPLGMATTRGTPAAGPATRQRNPAVAAARLPAPRTTIPDVDDRDEFTPATTRAPTPTLITTRAAQTLPTPPAHHSHRRATKTSTAATSVTTTATRVANPTDHG
jgi:hypothetical protein